MYLLKTSCFPLRGTASIRASSPRFPISRGEEAAPVASILTDQSRETGPFLCNEEEFTGIGTPNGIAANGVCQLRESQLLHLAGGHHPVSKLYEG